MQLSPFKLKKKKLLEKGKMYGIKLYALNIHVPSGLDFHNV